MAFKPSNISSFLSTVRQGVKPNLFEVKFEFPQQIGNPSGLDDVSTYMCKAAALPASNLGVIEVPFRGRTVKIAGDRTFDTWTVTFINDGKFIIRKAMEEWMAKMNKHEGNTSDIYTPDKNGGTGYFADLLVNQLERDGSNVLRAYKLIGAFPTNVSQMDLAYDSNDQIEDFTVEFQYQYWEVDSSGEVDGEVG